MMYFAYKLNEQGDNIRPWHNSFPNLEPVHCSMSSFICLFLTSAQISQDIGKVVWYSHLFKNFPQFVVIHTVRGFNVVSEEVDTLLEFSCFFYDPTDVGNLLSGACAFSETSLNIWKFSIHTLLKPSLKNFQDYFASVWDKSTQLRDVGRFRIYFDYRIDWWIE